MAQKNNNQFPQSMAMFNLETNEIHANGKKFKISEKAKTKAIKEDCTDCPHKKGCQGTCLHLQSLMVEYALNEHGFTTR